MFLPLLLLFAVPPLIYLTTHLTHPLRSIPPAHPLARFTSLWILYIRHRAIENATLKAAHSRLGPVIRLSPNEVSVNCVKGGLREVYAGGMEKAGWYEFFGNYGGVTNMFSTPGSKPHSTRKRMLSNVYSKSVINSSEALLAQTSAIVYKRMLPRLQATFSKLDLGVLDMYSFLSACTMDIVTAYIFGLSASSNLTCNQAELEHFLHLYNSRRSFNFWPQELPAFTDALRRWFGFRLSPQWVDDANAEIEAWTMKMCENATVMLRESEGEGLGAADTPAVYSQLSSALAKESKKNDVQDKDRDLLIASEVLDHLAAGFDTSAITLTYVVHELSLHPRLQDSLHAELLTLSPPVIPDSAPNLPDPKTLDALPLLHAVIWETLRLHSAIPGPQPRVTPAGGCRLGPEEASYWVPGGVRVSASAGILHSNEMVYEHAEMWRPERWLSIGEGGIVEDEETRKVMDRWFWAFSSGGRMCVGSNLAVYQMKYIIAAIYSNFSTSVVDDTGIEQSDAYTAPPKKDKLIIKLQSKDLKHVSKS